MEVENPSGDKYTLIPLFVTLSQHRNETLEKLIQKSTTEITESTCWGVVTGKTRKSYLAVPEGPVKLQKNSELLKGATPLEVLAFWREYMDVPSQDEVEELAALEVFGILDDKSYEDHRILLVEDFGMGPDASQRAQESAARVNKERGNEGKSPLWKDERPIVKESEVGATPVAIAEDVTACRVRFRHALEMSQCYQMCTSQLERFDADGMYPDDNEDSEPEEA